MLLSLKTGRSVRCSRTNLQCTLNQSHNFWSTICPFGNPQRDIIFSRPSPTKEEQHWMSYDTEFVLCQSLFFWLHKHSRLIVSLIKDPLSSNRIWERTCTLRVAGIYTFHLTEFWTCVSGRTPRTTRNIRHPSKLIYIPEFISLKSFSTRFSVL